MIIPIGHEDSGTRRIPWVTVSIVALCMAAWGATLYARATLEVRSPEHYQDRAWRFWEDHPYLEMDEALAFHMLEKERPDLFQRGARPNFSEAQWDRWLEDKQIRASFGAEAPPRDQDDLEAEQAELARITLWGFYRAPDEIPPEGGTPADRFGLTPGAPTGHGFFTHIFMHASWAHILGNLFLLFLVAPALEDRWGRPLFGVFYLVSGIFAGGFFAALSLGSDIPLVGASGAIAGVLGAFLVLYWKTKIKFMYFFVLPPVLGTFRLAAWVVLPFWLANEVLGAVVSGATGAQGGVAYWAHIGGFLFGAGFAVCVKGFELERKYLDKAIEWKVTLAQGKQMVEAARRALEEGIYEEAFLLFQQEAANRPRDLDSVMGYWESSVAFDKPEEGALPLLAWIRAELAAERESRAAEAWCRAIEIERSFPIDGPTLVKLVPTLAKLGRGDAAVSALRYVLSSENPSLNAAMALRARQLAAELDPATELLAIHRVLVLAELPVEKEERLRERMDELRAEGTSPCDDPFAESHVEEKVSPGSALPSALPAALLSAPTTAPAEIKSDPASPARESTSSTGEYDPLGLSDGRAIDIELEDDRPPVVPVPDAASLPPAVDEPDMSYFGENSSDTEPLGLMEPFDAMDTPHPALAPLADAVPPAVSSPVASSVSNDLDIELGGPVSLPRFRDAKRSEVVPVQFAPDHLVLQIGDGSRSKLALTRIEAVASAVVEDVSARPVLIIDLLLNWRDTEAEVLKVVRLRSNTFDPRSLLPNAGAGMQALRAVLAHLHQAAGAEPLPSAAALAGQPFSRFGRLVDYEREVLDIAG